MADNPLFPGYKSDKPNDGPNNPIFPGYYPGAPIIRKPKYTNFIQPLEYSADETFKYIDDVTAHVTGAPQWVTNRVIDDWKQSMKASYNPGDIPIEQLDDYDADALPGVASAQLSLNPMDWIKPGEQAEKTIKTWVTSVTGVKFDKNSWLPNGFNTDDYENRVKTAIWGNVLGVTKEDAGSSLLREAAKTTAENTAAFHPDFDASKPQPFKLTDSGVIGDWTKTDLYGDLAQKAIDFEVNVGSMARDKKHDAMLLAMFGAMDAELNGQTFDSGYKPYKHDAVLDAIGPAGSAERTQAENALKYFHIQKLAVDKMKASESALTGGTGLLADIEKKLSGRPRYDNFAEEIKDAAGNVIGYNGKFVEPDPAKLLKAIDEHLHGKFTENTVTNTLYIAKDVDKGIDQFIQDAHALGGNAGKTMEKSLSEYKTYLEKLQKTVEASRNDPYIVMLNKIKNVNSGDVRMRTITGGNLMTGNIQRTYLENMQNQFLHPGTNKSVPKELQIGSVLKNNAVSSMPDLYANRARILASRFATEQNAKRITEAVDAIADGKFMERYVWNTISVKITGYTPKELTDRALKKVNYFGFVVDESYEPTSKVAQAFYNSRLMRNSFTITANGISAKLNGGIEFSGALTLAGLHAQGLLTKSEIGELLAGTKDLAAFKSKLPGPTAFINRKETQLDIDTFRKWLDSKSNPFKIKSDGDIDKLMELMKALGKENSYSASLSVTAKYAGFMQRWGVTLSKLQDQIYDRFGVALKPLFQVKTILSEKAAAFFAKLLSTWIPKLLAMIGVVGTDGLGAILLPFLEKVLAPIFRAILDKAGQYFNTFISSLLHGNWDAMIKQAEKEIENVIKAILRGFGILAVIIAVPMIMLWGVVLITISPIDPTKSNVGYGGGAAFENPYMDVTKDVSVGGQTNPTDPLDNSSLPLKAIYTITITAKQDLPQLSYIDIAKIIQLEQNARQLLNTKGIIPAIKSGESYSFNVELELGTGDKDSVIFNMVTVTLPESFPSEFRNATASRVFTVGKPPYDPNCFKYQVGSDELAYFQGAVENLVVWETTVVNRTCSGLTPGTQISLIRVGDADTCGWSLGYGSSYDPNNFVILFGNKCPGYYSSAINLNYLLAHEMGHAFDSVGLNKQERIRAYNKLAAAEAYEGNLPTYNNGCGNNSVKEDFAESIGDYAQVNVDGCSAEYNGDRSRDGFWQNFPKHKEFVEWLLYRL